jgi:hypothetical protein
MSKYIPSFLKLLEYALAFGAWGALIIMGDTTKPGAQTFIIALASIISGRSTYHILKASALSESSAEPTEPGKQP